MDRLNIYKQIITKKFEQYAQSWNENDKLIKTQVIIDLKEKQFLLIRHGWRNDADYVHYCVFHIDIINDKVWIQENRTDILIAEELVGLGIDKNDIVLGLLPPQLREDSEYAYA